MELSDQWSLLGLLQSQFTLMTLIGHSLEFIGLLDGKSRPEKGIVSYEEWLKIENN